MSLLLQVLYELPITCSLHVEETIIARVAVLIAALGFAKLQVQACGTCLSFIWGGQRYYPGAAVTSFAL